MALGPLCKLCGRRHWGIDHVWGEEAPAQPQGVPGPTIASQAAECAVVVEVLPKPTQVAAIEQARGPVKREDVPPIVARDAAGRFDRVAYQRVYMRGYMRQRRAKAREAQG